MSQHNLELDANEATGWSKASERRRKDPVRTYLIIEHQRSDLRKQNKAGGSDKDGYASGAIQEEEKAFRSANRLTVEQAEGAAKGQANNKEYFKPSKVPYVTNSLNNNQMVVPSDHLKKEGLNEILKDCD